MDNQPTSVPISGILAMTQQQRNKLADENAMLWAHVEELTTERDQLTAELAQLRPDSSVS